MKVAAYRTEIEAREKEKELENCEKTLLRKEVSRLKEFVQALEEKLKDQLNLADLKLMQKDEKIENLMNQITQLSTSNNVRESQFHREKSCLEKEIQDLRSALSKSHELDHELQHYKKQYEILLQEKMDRAAEVDKGNDSVSESEEYDRVLVEKRPTLVDIDVQRNVNYVSSSSGEQCTGEISRFHSGETTVAANSFLPNLGNSIYNQSPPKERRGLSYKENDDIMMNITPVVPAEDFDIPPPSFSNFGFNRKPPLKLYESISESFSKPNPPKSNSIVNSRRNDVLKNLHMLTENLPPPPPPPQIPFAHSEEPVGEPEPPFVPKEVITPEPAQRNENVSQ